MVLRRHSNLNISPVDAAAADGQTVAVQKKTATGTNVLACLKTDKLHCFQYYLGACKYLENSCNRIFVCFFCTIYNFDVLSSFGTVITRYYGFTTLILPSDKYA